jgi:type VI protein secretion system component Hcp
MKRILGLALIAGLALTGLTACMGDDDGGNAAERRRSAALVDTAAGQRASGELTITGLTAIGQAIEVESFSWGIANPAGTAPQFEGLNVTKLMDEVSPLLYKGVAQGTIYTSAVLKLNKMVADTTTTYATYELTGVQISSLQKSSSTERIPTESATLKFASLKESFTTTDKGGKAVTTSYLYSSKG